MGKTIGGYTLRPELDNEFNLKIELYGSEKLVLLTDYSALYNQYEPFANWMNNPDVPAVQKAPYQEMLINAMRSMSFMYDFMTKCGISKQEIEEYQKIPF